MELCVFHVVQTLRFMDDFFWSGGFFGVVMDDSKTFAGFDVIDFRSRWIQSIVPARRLLASSGVECLPLASSGSECRLGAHSDVRV